MTVLAGTETEGAGSTGAIGKTHVHSFQVEALHSGTVEKIGVKLVTGSGGLIFAIREETAEGSKKPTTGTPLGEITGLTAKAGTTEGTFGTGIKIEKGKKYWIDVGISKNAEYKEPTSATLYGAESSNAVTEPKAVTGWETSTLLGPISIWGSGAEEEKYLLAGKSQILLASVAKMAPTLSAAATTKITFAQKGASVQSQTMAGTTKIKFHGSLEFISESTIKIAATGSMQFKAQGATKVAVTAAGTTKLTFRNSASNTMNATAAGTSKIVFAQKGASGVTQRAAGTSTVRFVTSGAASTRWALTGTSTIEFVASLNAHLQLPPPNMPGRVLPTQKTGRVSPTQKAGHDAI